ncbi:MAG TPA: Tat pathway signal sequence domain protein [Yinghuangia sp.]|nr:Tat pathway signal sequence domain protein [Yinghuangia sp.]
MSVQPAPGDDVQAASGAGTWSRRAFVRSAAAGTAVVVAAPAITSTSASAAEAPQCVAPQPGGPVWVTPGCADAPYDRPVIDSETDLTAPVPHRRVSGHFDGTDKKFTIYLPPKRQWQGRFFQNVYPLQNEVAEDANIAFGAASGAYTVQTNGGGGYRVDAAAAKFGRVVAARYYGRSGRIHGYIWGGSGGSFQTIGAMENTSGVWDGAVPFIPGSPVAIPNFFFIRAVARLVLAEKAAQIEDAVRPGGSGDPYAGLNDVERAVLREVTRMGVPLRAWQNHRYVLGLDDAQGLLGFGGTVRAMDPTYADDFWGKPGHLGTEQSPLGELFRAARIDHTATVTRVDRDAQNTPTALVLDSVPANPRGTLLDFAASRSDGTAIGTLAGTLDSASRVFTLAAGNSPEVLGALAAGGRLRSDNRWSLALVAYHRHQVPTRAGFDAWDQFRAADGRPVYPQRAFEVGPALSRNVSGGGTFTGKITGKMIVVTNILDNDAYPWDADWYRTQVRQSLGGRADSEMQIWFNDNADHLGAHLPGLVDYSGILQRALRDVSAWAERGTVPAQPTRYTVSNGQIEVPASAARRGGVQPVVDLTVGGRDRIEIPAGRSVTFKAEVQVPPGAGHVVAADWDFTGSGDFRPATVGSPRPTVRLSATFTYRTPGTYFPVLRVAANRDGDADTSFAAVRNLARVRVVVR